MEYDFDVMHIRGIKNIVADYLSRYTDKEQLENFKEGDIPLANIKDTKMWLFQKPSDRNSTEDEQFRRVFYANIPECSKSEFIHDPWIKHHSRIINRLDITSIIKNHKQYYKHRLLTQRRSKRLAKQKYKYLGVDIEDQPYRRRRNKLMAKEYGYKKKGGKVSQQTRPLQNPPPLEPLSDKEPSPIPSDEIIWNN
jgi:hypothetical protein